MNLYTFTCPACAHTFRRILSDPARAVACPLCDAQAVREGEASLGPPTAPGPRPTRAPGPAPRAEAGVAAHAGCSASPDGEDT